MGAGEAGALFVSLLLLLGVTGYSLTFLARVASVTHEVMQDVNKISQEGWGQTGKAGGATANMTAVANRLLCDVYNMNRELLSLARLIPFLNLNSTSIQAGIDRVAGLCNGTATPDNYTQAP